jgi:hypothetical protein
MACRGNKNVWRRNLRVRPQEISLGDLLRGIGAMENQRQTAADMTRKLTAKVPEVPENREYRELTQIDCSFHCLPASGIFIRSSIKFSPWTYDMLISISVEPIMPSIEIFKGPAFFPPISRP